MRIADRNRHQRALGGLLQSALILACVSACTGSTLPAPSAPVIVGLPAGWAPEREVTGDIRIQTDGEVLEDLRVTAGTIYVEARNVTLRRIEGIGARVFNNSGNRCGTGLTIENSTFRRGGLGAEESGEAVIGVGGYVVRNVLIDSVPEGLRVGEAKGCGGVTVEQARIRITPPDVCGDWHGDGIQGYGGGALKVRNSMIELVEENGCFGTAAFFYPGEQGNSEVDIDGLRVSGGGYPFRLGTPGTVSGLQVVDESWGYAPVDVTSCAKLNNWRADVVRVDDTTQKVSLLRAISCAG